MLAGGDALRFVAPEALHLTLAFLGYRPEGEIAGIASAAFEAVEGLHGAQLTPLSVRDVPQRRPRLVALELEDAGGRASALQAATASALAAGGYYEPEKRPFWPHITIARVRKGRRAGPFEGGGLADDPAGRPFAARELTLYRSILRPQGALYEALERLTLRD